MSAERRATPFALNTLAADLTSGMVVFLVALPLCLGVALASNAPLFSGILAGIVGGILVGALSGSHTSVSGPAAGLTAVVAAQIALLGSFETFLLALVIAGALQIGLGLLRAGSIADFVPTSVIKGLLASIGLILILKQIPHLFGHDSDPEGDMAFSQPDHENTFSSLLEMMSDIHIAAALVGLISLAILLIWDRIKPLKRSPVPAPLVVVVAGVGLGLLFSRWGSDWIIGGSHLVQVPVADSLMGFLGFLQLPDWAQIVNPRVFSAAITIAAVASLETLLNLEAVDKLDHERRVSPPNRELLAQGVGNLASGLIGGLPVTSVIVRSSVNINSGCKTKLSTLVHGTLLLLCVALLPGVLNLIPLSCLAAVLIVTGFKLASPKVFRQMWGAGWDQFLPFILTVVAILLTDLLIGTLIGLSMGVLFILRSNLQRPLRRIVEQHVGSEVYRIELSKQVSFLNRVALSRALNQVPRHAHVLIDARNTDYVDADVLSLIMEYERETAPARSVQVSLLGLKEHYEQLADRVQYVDYATRELQSNLTPDQIQELLEEGNKRFRNGQPLTRDFDRLRNVTLDGQHPLAVVLSGTSSRTPVEMLFDVGIGDIFCVRTTGNFAGTGVLGSLEYATALAGAKLVVVLGHTKNNAVRMAAELRVQPQSAAETCECPYLDQIVADIQKSADPVPLARWSDWDESEQDRYVDELSEAHVLRTMNRIVETSPALRRCVEAGQVKIVGAMYDVRSGEVTFFDECYAPDELVASSAESG